MQFIQFLRVLYRRKLLLIAVPAVAAIVAYFPIHKMPDKYLSTSRLSTGLTDVSSELITQNQTEASVNQQFSNLIQQMHSVEIIYQVGYDLLLHDLTAQRPFRELSDPIKALNAKQKEATVNLIKKKYAQREELFFNNTEEYNLYKLLVSMKYDGDNLLKTLVIYRISNTDYISVEFISENRDLSVFVANAVSTEFITYYNSVLSENQLQAVNYLADLLQKKRMSMDSLTDELKAYKIQNEILNLNEETKSLYGQIADFETKRGIALRDIESYTSVINNINNKFKPEERSYVESSLMQINQDITATRELLYSANEDYIKTGFNEMYKPRIDSLRNVLAAQINEASDKYILNPLTVKKDLVDQKLEMEIQLEISKHSLQALQNELNRLNKRFTSLVPHEAEIQNFDYKFEVASREYIELLAKFNQASIVGNYKFRLKQIEIAQPTHALPSKKILYIILAGFSSFILCVASIFVAFYFDHSLYTPRDLANKTNTPVLGFLNDLKEADFNPAAIWKDDNISKELKIFKSLMRSSRFEIDRVMKGGGLLLITSIYGDDGKSFFALNLAYALAKANKTVVFMDADPYNDYVAQSKHALATIEEYFAGTLVYNFVPGEPLVVRTKSTTYRTLHEIAPYAAVKAKTDELKSRYDYVIVNVPSLQALNMPQEWLSQSDNIVAVFKAGHSIDELAKTKITFLKKLDKKFIGWIMNRIPDNELSYIKAT